MVRLTTFEIITTPALTTKHSRLFEVHMAINTSRLDRKEVSLRDLKRTWATRSAYHDQPTFRINDPRSLYILQHALGRQKGNLSVLDGDVI